jgi:hypothetical protein
MDDLIEAMAESLDEVLGEPASYELTGKIYAALKPHMEAALRETHRLVPKDQEPVGWRPIGTAPHDELILGHADEMIRLVMWEGGRWMQVGATIEAGWFEPIEWQPLPLYALEKRHD